VRCPASPLALCLALVVSVTACGTGDGEDGAPDGVALAVRYDDAAGRTSAGTVRCTRSGARATGVLRSRASPAALCRHARRSTALLTAPPDADRVCTLIFGGPQTARVTGRLGARRVDRRFSRVDGCAIADWDAAFPLLPRVRGAVGP
jgi:hypothetical protein